MATSISRTENSKNPREAWVRLTHTDSKLSLHTGAVGRPVSRQICFSQLPLIPYNLCHVLSDKSGRH